MKNRHKKNTLGSTVIEVLIATTIVAFALTGLAALMTNNVKNSAEADYREAAAGIAQDTMERIRQKKTTTAWSSFIAAPYGATGCNDDVAKYNTTFYTTCTPATGSGDEITVLVTVCWPGTATGCVSGAKTTAATQRFYNN